jgi:beta-amylase
LASLADAARKAGHDEWGHGGPHDCGDYNSQPEETGFYNHEGSWDSPYGRWVLKLATRKSCIFLVYKASNLFAVQI